LGKGLNDLHLIPRFPIFEAWGNTPRSREGNMTTTNTYIDNHGNIVCSIHMDASVMNSHDECDECLDDAHELEILSR
jgi:hypothetical protein